MYSFYDQSYFIYVLPAIILAMFAQAKIKSAYSKYSRVNSGTNYTGATLARKILDDNDLKYIAVERAKGTLSDHFDPRREVIRLSEGVYDSTSIAALGIAAHECGHAIQKQVGYAPYSLRAVFAPIASFASSIAWMAMLIGLTFIPVAFDIGVLAFLAIFLFQLVTLPVEFDASRRAKLIVGNMFNNQAVSSGVSEILNAAALTYVAATLTALGQLIRIMSYRRRD